MLEQFLRTIGEGQLIHPEQKVLLAVSGGIDSMVLLHLFEKSGLDYGVAHCNFSLRGDESDGDEDFVRDVVLKNGTPAFFERFNTREYAQLKGISIEMAARELRYTFFEQVRAENEYDWIATAHHQDDVIETFFLNLSRKTGIKGLSGIKEKSGGLIRPLLFADREMIEQYAAENYLDYREDSSNGEMVFQRNFLRHKILPLFTELNPAFKKNMLASITNLKDAEHVYSNALQLEKLKVLRNENNGVSVNIQQLEAATYPKILLHEILSEYNFNATVVDEVYQSLNSLSGKQFYSPTHRAVKDRATLFVSKRKQETEERVYYIEKDDLELFEPLDLLVEHVDIAHFELEKNNKTASIDADKIEFPLLLRKWKQGDYFQPLGMTGMKKVSDFFIDRKIPLYQKENTWLLCSGKKIVWIVGLRLDERFKVSSSTQQVVKIKIK